jgi:hypothetical protein
LVLRFSNLTLGPLALDVRKAFIGNPHCSPESAVVDLGFGPDCPDHESPSELPVEGSPGAPTCTRTKLPKATAAADLALVRVAQAESKCGQLVDSMQHRDSFWSR